MGLPSYMRSVVDRNVIMQRIPVTLSRIVDCAAYRLHRNEVHTLRGHLCYSFSFDVLHYVHYSYYRKERKKAAVLAYINNFSCFCMRFEVQTVVTMNVIPCGLVFRRT